MKVYERMADAIEAEGTTMIIDARISRAVINLPHRRVLYGKDE